METRNKSRGRFEEIDFFRGLALLGMIVFHLVWDLKVFYDYPFDLEGGFYYWLGKVSGWTFILISGMSCAFSRNNVRRAVRVLAVAFGISLVTYFYDARNWIAFGILHLLGWNMLFYRFYRFLSPFAAFWWGTLTIIIGEIFLRIPMGGDLLFFLGLRSQEYASLDYFPLLPYSGIFLYGVALAKIFYPAGNRLFSINFPPNPISSLGRRTLILYLAHQPLILAGLYLLSRLELI
ncbi:MAG: heparan-alpha-glucosaminide N-acetyltransferase [Bacillota bacterium]|jgi:uncharacterized membrane protein